MAENLMKHYGQFTLILLSAISCEAWGQQTLSDPTRPPPGIYDATPAADRVNYPPVKGLQSVIISATHCAAIIDGKTVVLGVKHGNERLVEINERGVVLQGEHGRRTLTMFAAVGMKIAESRLPGNQPIKCKLEQITHTSTPPKQAGQKEKK